MDMKNKLTDISKEEADQLLASNPGVIVLAPVVTKEEILGRIMSKGWGIDMFGLPEPSKVVDPEKLAELLAEIINGKE